MSIPTNVSAYKTSANYLSDKTPPRCVSDAVEELYRFKNSHFDLMTGFWTQIDYLVFVGDGWFG